MPPELTRSRSQVDPTRRAVRIGVPDLERRTMFKTATFVAPLVLAVGVAAAVLVHAGQSQNAGAQDQPAVTAQTPTFRAQVEYVEVDVLVTDAKGQPVTGLTKDDFQVFEDGKRQNITNFAVVEIPLERPDRPLFQPDPIEPDVATNERPFYGRVYVLVLDDYHTGVLRTQLVKNAARQFIQRNLGSNDLMAITTTGGRFAVSQEFTSSRRLLLEAVDRFMGQKLDSATLTRTDQFYRQQGLGFANDRVLDPLDQERAFYARSTLRTIQRVSEWFGGVRGRRKTMLFISEGIDYDVTDMFRPQNLPSSSATMILDDMREAVAAAARSNVSIYSIDPRGLTSLADENITVESFPDDPALRIGLSSLNSELRLSQDSLRMLADQTGGFAAVNTNQFSDAFRRIVSDNSSYYVLAYYPPSTKRDGKFHKIEVKSTRPGLTVRARKGYQAPRGRATAPAPVASAPGKPTGEVMEAINSPIPVSGLSMRIFAAPFKGPAPRASVLLGVEVLGRDLSLAPDAKLEVSYYAFDGEGKPKAGATDSLKTNLRPETKTRVEATGLRLLSRMELAPGRYMLRVATHDNGNATSGSVTYDLEVPDFSKQPLSMSGVLLTSLSGAEMATIKQDELVKEVMPAPPIAARSFPQNDEIAIFAEIYDNAVGTPHRVDIVTTLQTDDGRVLFKAEEERASSELQGAKGGYGYATRIPLTDIAPGLYVLNVQARSRLGSEVGVGRQIRITITPAQGPQ
jgi:VWFA-related protein